MPLGGEDEEGAMTGAMRDALELIRSLKKQYPDETEDQLVSRFQKELEADRGLKRAIMRDASSMTCFKKDATGDHGPKGRIWQKWTQTKKKS